jgi:hypothetical protein
MKLATVNPELGFDIEQILSKQVNPLQSLCLSLYVILGLLCSMHILVCR